MLIESIPGEPLCFQTLPFNNPKVQFTFQARNAEQKLDWCLQLKNAILDSYQNSIPSHAKELVLAIGQSSRPVPGSLSPNSNHKQRFHVQLGRKMSAPEYLERRCKQAAAAAAAAAATSSKLGASLEGVTMRRKSMGSMLSTRSSTGSLLTSPLGKNKSFSVPDNNATVHSSSVSSLGFQLNAFQKSFRLRRSLKKSAHLIGNFSHLHPSNKIATNESLTEMPATSTPNSKCRQEPNSHLATDASVNQQLLPSLQGCQLNDSGENKLDNVNCLRNSLNGLTSLHQLREEQETVEEPSLVNVSSQKTSTTDAHCLIKHKEIDEEEEDEDEEEDDDEEDVMEAKRLHNECDCYSCNSIQFKHERACTCCNSGGSLAGSEFGLNGSVRANSFKEDDSGVGSSSSVCCYSLLRFGTPLGSQCSTLSSESHSSGNRFLWSGHGFGSTSTSSTTTTTSSTTTTANTLDRPPAVLPSSILEQRSSTIETRNLFDRLQPSYKRSNQLVRRVHSFTIGHRVNANSNIHHETTNATLELWSALYGPDSKQTPGFNGNCCQLLRHCNTEGESMADSGVIPNTNSTNDNSKIGSSTFCKKPQLQHRHCSHNCSALSRVHGLSSVFNNPLNANKRPSLAAIGLHAAAHHPLQHTVSFRKTANVDLLLARLRHLHRRPAMVAAAKAAELARKQEKERQKNAPELKTKNLDAMQTSEFDTKMNDRPFDECKQSKASESFHSNPNSSDDQTQSIFSINDSNRLGSCQNSSLCRKRSLTDLVHLDAPTQPHVWLRRQEAHLSRIKRGGSLPRNFESWL